MCNKNKRMNYFVKGLDHIKLTGEKTIYSGTAQT
jgi:hypothetical protein